MKNNKLVNSSIPWPRQGDQLFKPDVDWWHNACLNRLNDNWGLYAGGYKRAGDLLVEHIKDDQSEQDFLVYPIAFLYRQYIELRLKEVIRYGTRLLDSPKAFPKHHNLERLWKQCRKILEHVWSEGPTGDLDTVEDCIHQFSKTDPDSMAFRYPADKDDNPSLPDLNQINIRNLAEVTTRISSLLDGAVTGISAYLEI